MSLTRDEKIHSIAEDLLVAMLRGASVSKLEWSVLLLYWMNWPRNRKCFGSAY